MAVGIITPNLPLPATPSATKQTLAGAYVDLRDSGWAQQYLPDLMEKEAEVFGNRTISGFLAQVGAEEAMAADQVVWSEQGRLHVSASGSIANATDLAADKITVATGHGIRVNDTVVLNQAAGTLKCLVTEVGADYYKAFPYTQATMDATGGTSITFTASAVTGFVFGSEHKKGTGLPTVTGGTATIAGLEPQFASLTNKPAIIKDLYEVSGSDASAIGWIEVSGEEGQNGYLWYLKGNGDTMARFTDYCEMTCIEGELTATSAGTTSSLGALSGTEGLFAAIKSRGTVADAGFDSASESLATMDTLLKRFDTQGAIEENMMFLNRETSLAIDDMLASLNGSAQGNGTNANNAGTSFGLFDNSADMALNLGFTGFRRGSYDFYKSDWKYLNDATLRGAFVDVTGVIAPAGTSNVYDQMMGKNMKRPFLHVRYRASQTESRKMKTWITGSVGAATSNLDAMEVNYLSERCLVTQGANNFVLMTK
jgi:hypothetical protein